MGRFNWAQNPEADEMLYEHFKDLKSAIDSARIISALTGFKISRMSILGRRNRRGLVFTPDQLALQKQKHHTLRRVSEKLARPKKPRPVKIKLQKRYEVKQGALIDNTKSAWIPKSRETAPIEAVYDKVAPYMLPEYGQCKYIIGEGNDAYICQGSRGEHKAYCTEHRESCYK